MATKKTRAAEVPSELNGFPAIEPELHINVEEQAAKPVHFSNLFTVYDAEGKAHEVDYAVDAREMIESGFFFSEPPKGKA